MAASKLTFASELVRLRKARGIETQKELALVLGIAKQTVSRWEAGTSRPRSNQIERVASALNADAQQLLVAGGYAPAATANVSFDRPLPLASLSPESFERFALDFLSTLLEPGSTVHPAGKSGHTQYGLDITATFPNGKVHTFQCKREAAFGAAKVAKAVKAHVAKSDRKIILLSRIASPDARAEAARHRGWDIWDQENISQKFRTLPRAEQLRLVDIYFRGQRFALLGETSPGPWETADSFFAPFLVREHAFNHLWELVGREPELDAVTSSLGDPAHRVTMLIGTAGGGKTRVLRAALDRFAISNPHALVRLLSPTEQVSSKSLEDLGAAEKLLVVDDAHDRLDLGQLIRYVADGQSRATLLLVLRPYATESITRELANYGLSGASVKAVQLARPSKAEAVALATHVLESLSGPVQAAKEIADLAYDSPLAVVIGAFIVAKDRVHPQRFGSNEEFRTAVLKHYEQVIAKGIGTGTDEDRVRAVLRVFSLIQPALPDDPRVLELLENIEEIGPQDASRLSRKMIEAGVLFKRGVEYRLSPDLLADSIIETACIKQSGASNGYAERIYAAASAEQKAHLLLNLGRLDWRRSAGDTSTSRLLDGLWERLRWIDDYRNEDVKAAAQAAYYQPRQALSFARRLAEDGHGNNRDVCTLVRNAAYNLDYVTDACDILWSAGQSDDRQTNQHPEHPIRILSELATPEPRKLTEYCEAVVDFALELLQYEDSWHGSATPFDILRGALATEGHFTSMANSREMRMSAYGIDQEAVGSMRSKIVNAIFGSLTSNNKRRAFGAAKLISTAIRGPHGLLNRMPGPDETKAWKAEFSKTLERLAAFSAHAPLPPTLLVAIAQSVSWHAHHASDSNARAAQQILDLLDRDLETRTARILVDGWGRDTWRYNSNGERQAVDIATEQLISELAGRYPDAQTLASFLDMRLVELHEYGGVRYGAPHMLMNRLIFGRLDLAREVLTTQRSKGTKIGVYSPVALATLLKEAHDEAHHQIAGMLAIDDSSLGIVASAYTIFSDARPLSREDVATYRRIFASTDQGVLCYTPWLVRGLLSRDPVFAMELIIGAIASISPETRQQLLMWLCNEDVIPFDRLTDEQLLKIIDTLREPERLDDHWVGDFLIHVAARNPSMVVDLAKARLEESLAGDSWSKHPVGIVDRHHKSLEIIAHAQGASLFYELLEWSLDRADNYRFCSLFADLVTGLFDLHDKRCLQVLERWIEGGRKEHFLILAAIVREPESSFVLSQPEFVQRMLASARTSGVKSHSNLSSSLFASAIHGMRSGIPGEPFPADLELKAHAELQLTHLNRTDPSYQFYENIRRHASAEIERQLAERRRMDEEDSER